MKEGKNGAEDSWEQELKGWLRTAEAGTEFWMAWWANLGATEIKEPLWVP